MFEPLLPEQLGFADSSEVDEVVNVDDGSPNGYIVDDMSEIEYEVESVVASRKRSGVKQYKVKWKGYNNRHNVWRDADELQCAELIMIDDVRRV